MKKKYILLFFALSLLLSCLFLSACEREPYTYREIAGHDVAEITGIGINSSYFMSFREEIQDLSKASFLDLRFEETDRDMYSILIDHDEQVSQLDGFGVCILYIRADERSVNFILSEDGYLYCYSEAKQASLRSAERLDRAFFEDVNYLSEEQLDAIYQ